MSIIAICRQLGLINEKRRDIGSMQVPLLRSLTETQQNELLDELNYLNMAEIKSFCKAHVIPFTIRVESTHGKKRNEIDRKGVILSRIRHFLNTGEVLPPTCFAAKVVCFDRLAKQPRPDDRLYYGQYDKNNRAVFSLLKRLTEGQFRDGAIARIVAREFWSKGEAPTFRKYAAAWLSAAGEHTEAHPEWAFLADRARGIAGSNWKRLRAKKAAKVMKLLNAIPESPALQITVAIKRSRSKPRSGKSRVRSLLKKDKPSSDWAKEGRTLLRPMSRLQQ